MRRKKKFRRELKAALTRELFHRRPPAPRHAVLLPLLNNLAVLSAAIGSVGAKDRARDRRYTPEFLDEVRMSLHRAMVGKPFLLVKGRLSENRAGDFSPRFPHVPDVDKGAKKRRVGEVGARLRATMKALGFKTIRSFAHETDIHENLLSKYMNGAAMPAAWWIQNLVEKYGLTYDWVMAGDLRFVPHELRTKITEHMADEE